MPGQGLPAPLPVQQQQRNAGGRRGEGGQVHGERALAGWRGEVGGVVVVADSHGFGQSAGADQVPARRQVADQMLQGRGGVVDGVGDGGAQVFGVREDHGPLSQPGPEAAVPGNALDRVHACHGRGAHLQDTEHVDRVRGCGGRDTVLVFPFVGAELVAVEGRVGGGLVDQGEGAAGRRERAVQEPLAAVFASLRDGPGGGVQGRRRVREGTQPVGEGHRPDRPQPIQDHDMIAGPEQVPAVGGHGRVPGAVVRVFARVQVPLAVGIDHAVGEQGRGIAHPVPVHGRLGRSGLEPGAAVGPAVVDGRRVVDVAGVQEVAVAQGRLGQVVAAAPQGKGAGVLALVVRGLAALA